MIKPQDVAHAVAVVAFPFAAALGFWLLVIAVTR